MRFWLDEHLSPALVRGLRERLGAEALHVRDLGFQRAADRIIFAAARQAEASS